jgi:hypothetical protein
MLNREHVLLACIAVLILTCIYLFWQNRRLKNQLKETFSNKQQENVVEQPDKIEEDMPAATYHEGTTTQNEDDDDESIPDDLKEQINNLNEEVEYIEQQEVVYEEQPVEYVEQQEVVYEEQPVEYVEQQEVVYEEQPVEYVEQQEVVYEEQPVEYVEEEVNMLNDEENLNRLLEEKLKEIENISAIDEEVLGEPESEVLEDEAEAESEEEIKIHTEESLNELTIKQLKEICQDNDLKVRAKDKKSELIERILSL